MRFDRMASGGGLALAALSVFLIGGSAGASFSGSDGDIAWMAPCNNNQQGQQIFSAPHTSTGLTCPSYSAVTGGALDSMPSFAPYGVLPLTGAPNLVFFSSDNSGGFGLFYVPYPNTGYSSSNDQRVALTNASGTESYEDYAPSVSGDGKTLSWIRCSPTCNLMIQSISVDSSTGQLALTGTGTVGPVVYAPHSDTGDGNRPVFDPVDSNLIVYVDPSQHLELYNRTAQTSTDLTAETGGTAYDEHPDWSPDGKVLAFDSNRSSSVPNYFHIWLMTGVTSATPSARLRWSNAALPSGQSQEDPAFAPSTGQAGVASTDSQPTLVWTVIKAGSNIYVDDGSSVNNPSVQDYFPVTNSRVTNTEPVWEPGAPAVQTPETPLAVALPGAGAVVLFGSAAFARRRRRAAMA